jgi:zinc protease
MNLKRLFASAFVALAAVSVNAQDMSQMMLPQDTAVRVGKLSNGLTYYIRHNGYPEHVANFYIAQRVGSIQEEESQRGLAHFLEHMAFNGSEHFKENGIIEFTRGLGVEFGSDLNAYTSIDQTVYRVCNVPTKRQSALDSCLLILKDWSNGLDLDAKEIDKERGVIHGEWAMRNNASMRMFEGNLPKLYPGSKYGVRMPIGLMSVVDNFKPDFLRAYYKKWYRPDNQAIIVVGDVDVDHTEAMIKQIFGKTVVLANAAQVVAEPVPDNNEPIYIFAKDKEMQNNVIMLSMKSDPFPDSLKNTPLYYVQDFLIDASVRMINNRFAEMAQDPNCPFTSAQCSYGNYVISKTKSSLSVESDVKEGKDLEALAALERELQRVRQFGFTATEFARTKAEIVSIYEKNYSNRDKRKNDYFGNMYRDNYLSNEPIHSAELAYQMQTQIANMIPVEAINEGVKEMISVTDTNLVVFEMAREKDGLTYPTEADMRKSLEAARAEKLTAWVDNVKDEPLISQLPKKGSIKKEVENKTLGYKKLTLSNGATVILKKTDFKDDEVRLTGFAKGGNSQFGDDDYANISMFNSVIGASGLGNFSNTELDKALAGKQASCGLSLGMIETNVSGSSTPKDVETMLQLLYLKFTAVTKDQKSFDNTMEQYRLSLKSWGTDPQHALLDTISANVYANKKRFGNLHLADLDNVSYDRIIAMQKQAYANAGAFTFVIVGNFDEATIRPLVEQYIASLPAKAKMQKAKDIPLYAKGCKVIDFKKKMETPKPYVLDFIQGSTVNTLENDVMLSAATDVLSMELLKDVREDAGAAYSVGASGNSSREKAYDVKPVLNIVQIYAPISAPEKIDTAMLLISRDTKNAGVTIDAEKLEKVKSNMLKNADINAKNNGYWLRVIKENENEGIDIFTNYKQVVQSMTPEKVAAHFKKTVLDGGNSIRIVMRPE